MPALEMVVMGRIPYLGLFGIPGTEDYKVARQIAADLNISNLLDRSFNDLSGGQKQMIMIACTLCSKPSAIIFDEPMSALDYSNQNRILFLTGDIAGQGMSIIFTTHDPTHAIHVADKAPLIKDSHLHYYGPVDDILVDTILRDVYGMPFLVHEIQGNVVINPGYGQVT